MNTERTEKFVNAIACDLEEGGFRQVSGTTLRRTLATAVSAALPLLADTGIPASQPAELAEQQDVDFDIDDVRELFEQWAKGRNLTPDTWGVSAYVCPYVDNDFDVWRAAWKALASTGKKKIDPPWSLHDRVEFALRDAGFDLDEASRIALQVDGKQQVGENPAWRDELVREAHARGLMEGLNSPRPQQVGEVQGDSATYDKAADLVSRLYMARDMQRAGEWSYLFAEAADALAARQPGAVE
jgi:hypothetical protein